VGENKMMNDGQENKMMNERGKDVNGGKQNDE